MADHVSMDPDALQEAANKLRGFSSEVTSHGSTLSTATSAPVGKGGIGEVVEGFVKRGIKAASEDIPKAVTKFYEDTATGLEHTLKKTTETDDLVKSGFTKTDEGLRPSSVHADPGAAKAASIAPESTSKVGSDPVYKGGDTSAADPGPSSSGDISSVLGGHGGDDRLPSSYLSGEGGDTGLSVDTKRLGTLNESDVTRDENGLITKVGDKDINDYLNDLGMERGQAYRDGAASRKNPTSKEGKAQIKQAAAEGKTLPPFKNEQGVCVAVGADRRTGHVYEGLNGRPHIDLIPPDKVHPTLQSNLDHMSHAGPYSHGDGKNHPFPHPDSPTGHAEVKATNQALWDRQDQKLPTHHDALGEISMAPQFHLGKGGVRPAPFCANCNGTLHGVASTTGRFTGFPPSDDNLIP